MTMESLPTTMVNQQKVKKNLKLSIGSLWQLLIDYGRRSRILPQFQFDEEENVVNFQT